MEFKFDFDADRLGKLDAMRSNGFNPFGSRFETTSNTGEIRRDFEKLDGKEVKIAGRIMARRDHGKLKFFDLADENGNIQIYVTEKELETKSAELLEYLDAGDIIGVTGKVIKTKTGELSVQAKTITILSKSLLSLPSKWYGLEDTEKRYRKRYLDFIMNRDSREKIKKGSIMLTAIRELLEKKDFLEVTVPLLHPIPGGTNARPFVTHYHALDRDLFLKIASELYLKRLLVGGFEKIYDISKNLRNEGVDTRHNPEFLAFELYQAYGDLSDMLAITEEIIKAAIFAANKTYVVEHGENKIDFSKFIIKTMEDSVKETLKETNQKDLISMAQKIDKKVHNACTSYPGSSVLLFPLFV